MKMELKETAVAMTSPDYKERFRAEYFQLLIRYQKLREMTKKWDEGTLNFEPTCPRDIYDQQLKAMAMYLGVLQQRAALEQVDISSGDAA